jgi:hypothetical protein
MNGIAERYVHLVLSLGQHDPDHVDAFYGPLAWKTQARQGWRVRSKHLIRLKNPRFSAVGLIIERGN